jgi:hypothetical protein
VALAAVLLFACGRAGEATSTTARAVPLDLSPVRQVDWLPSDAMAVLHVDVDKLRDTRLYHELAMLLPEHPPARAVIERTHALRVAVVMRGEEPQLCALFSGDYDEHVNPSVLVSGELRAHELDGLHVLEHTGSHDRWVRTPEGFWLTSEQTLWPAVAVLPEKRTTRLSARAWARAPAHDPLFHVSLLMSPLWRERMAASLTDPMSASMFLPAVEELNVITFDVENDGAGGFMLELSADFTSERGSQSAAFVLQAALIAARAAAQDSGEPQPQAKAPEGDDQAYALGREVGRSFAGLLDALVLDVQDTRLRASLTLTSDMLEDVRARVREAVARAAQENAATTP